MAKCRCEHGRVWHQWCVECEREGAIREIQEAAMDALDEVFGVGLDDIRPPGEIRIEDYRMTCESNPGELRYDPHRDEWQCARCGYTSSSLNLSILGRDVARQEHQNHAKRARVSKTDPTNALPAHYQA